MLQAHMTICWPVSDPSLAQMKRCLPLREGQEDLQLSGSWHKWDTAGEKAETLP